MASHCPSSTIVDAPVPRISSESCLGRTCMKWQPDGELTSLVLQLILQRLSRTDAQLNAQLGLRS